MGRKMTCQFCGSPTEPGARFCASCGKPLSPAATEHPASSGPPTGSAAIASPTISSGNAFTWPFEQLNWASNLWVLLLAWIPVFGWIPALTITEGWMIDAIGRFGRHDSDKLPHPRDIPRMFAHGIVYWVMLFLYAAVPVWILGVIFATETTIITHEFGQWVTDSTENAAITTVNVVSLGLGGPTLADLIPQQTLLSLVERWAAVYTAGFVLPVLWLVFALPVFMAATIRFGVTNRIGSYFHPIANTGFVLRHPIGFAWLFIVMIAVNFVAALLPVIGIYIWLTAGIWIVAHCAGRLATKLRLHDPAPAPAQLQSGVA